MGSGRLSWEGLWLPGPSPTHSHMVRTGSTLYEAQAAAGHKSPRSTQLYANLGPSRRRCPSSASVRSPVSRAVPAAVAASR
jgi:hypothetical protein